MELREHIGFAVHERLPRGDADDGADVREALEEDLDAAAIGWFAARQPAIIRFCEDQLWRPDGDAFAVGLDAACRLCRLYQEVEGVAPPRLGRGALVGGMAAAADDEEAGPPTRRRVRMLAWLARHLDDPPLPLTRAELVAVGVALRSLVFALDAIAGDEDDTALL
jgi:hypothetical protein